LNVLVYPIGNVTIEDAISLELDLEFVADKFLTLFNNFRHALETDGWFTGSKEPDGWLRRPGEKLFHAGDREFEVDSAVAGLNRVSPMWNVAVGAIQVARARHEKADAVFSIVSHLAKTCCMRQTKKALSGMREANVMSANGLFRRGVNSRLIFGSPTSQNRAHGWNKNVSHVIELTRVKCD
jgi:hypothetical protein